jgi:hypothetical protein
VRANQGEDCLVLFLVSGSSGAGKSTLVRRLPNRVANLAVHELGEIATTPWEGAGPWWRRDLTERWLDRAHEYEREGVDMVLTEGVLGELLAAPSATRLEGIAASLLDCHYREQLRRIRARERSDDFPPKQLWDFVSWAAWLRWHADDPRIWTGPIRGDGDTSWAWERWEGWEAGDPRWSTFVLDTTAEDVEGSTRRLVRWIDEQRGLRGDGRLPLSGRWWD